MTSMYCDRCAQIDQSITISALLDMDSSPQFSQGVGGIIHDGEYTPVLSTSMSRDTALIDLKVKARAYGSLENVLLEKGVAKPVSRGNALKLLSNLAPGLVAVILGLFTLGYNPFPYFDQNLIFHFVTMLLAMLLMILGGARNKKIFQAHSLRIQNEITPEMRILAARRERGSYCYRCNIFSPEH